LWFSFLTALTFPATRLQPPKPDHIMTMNRRAKAARGNVGGDRPIDEFVQNGRGTGMDIDRVLIPRERIASRVAELGRLIAAELNGEPVTLAAVMTGSLIFVADLIRQLPVPMRIHLVDISSYPGTATNSHGPKLLSRLPEDLAGRNVLIVDDILDSGRTLATASRQFRQAGARRVLTCVLVRKPSQRRAPDGLAEADFLGFDIPDEFIVGYGLDYGDYYRNLPDIAVLKAPPACQGTDTRSAAATPTPLAGGHP
jgi:hypoxanthine phosphoribosyltransferase